ncbi:MAG TPA: transpeptidase family protein [Fermentimonas caenicola]|jgi:cell division protein FtsI (penicillin-binding protein 3)|uniref:penicillin-binding protein n=1 Tax=Lascolabacillus sp. TaxID=1924068 RepID=UPI000A68B6B4|nr:penicillin-binding protein [Lascolabacillus sp.]MBP6196754.1 transpeptidase family protein [Fermentimonas sp.]MDI9625416.1 penicillin-binding protein [Bacteroidota bacterium]TAH61533.1 MAG: PASTA domain-containing protein [Fermentimonas caenicola]MBP7103676.1 transpeptidase family protein [Fermentimonas sp.]MDD3657521.1 penicillin-binding protein [Lascolabacillus sp.]
MKEQDKNRKNKGILGRYGLIVSVLMLFSFMIIFSAGRIMFSAEGRKWREVGEKETVIRDRVILPKRGNIYTYDDKLLASTEPIYSIYMDFWADGMKKDTLVKYVDDLSVALARKFPDRTASQYKNIIMNGWNLREKEERQILENKNKGIDERVPIRSRYVKILRNDINYIDLKEIRTFPFWNQRSNRSGLIAEERNSRKKPFGNLANRTVGSVYKDIEKGGASGLELKYDSLLRGVPGVKYRQKIQGKWMDVVEEPAKEGWDIVTTIDADIQDIAERALKSKLVETEAESGTAIIMEVKSGEIKGIVNLDRLSNGDYAEGNPNAFSYMNEPGSTFKTVTTMIALDDGVITPTDSFYVGNGLFQYNKRWVRDHYWRRGQDRGYLTVAEGMELSSNVVMSKIVLKGYEDKPEKFVDGIDRIGLRKQLTWDVPLNGIEGTSSIRYPNDKNNYWSKTTLPWMSFGYETQIPPIYMLMFYNAIANGGKMIKPFIAKQFLENGKVVKEFEAEVVNPKICKESTLEEIKKMLVGVVENGTAKVVASDYFSIAGKTGTAQIAGGGGYSGYYVSFSGYFPADEPMYTIFVGLRKPKGVPSGGGMAGMVFKNIAEQTYLRKVRLLAEDCKVDSTLQKAPEIKHGNWNNNKYVLNKLNLSVADKNSDSDWVKIKFENNEYLTEEIALNNSKIPDVKGMGARDAVYLLEKSGLRVNLIGSGKVVSQSFTPGQNLVKGTTITITLR